MILLQKDNEIGPVSNIYDKYARSKEKVRNLDKEDQGESRIDLTNLLLKNDRTLLQLVTKKPISRMFEMFWSNLEIIVC